MKDTELIRYIEQSNEILQMSQTLQSLHTGHYINHFMEVPFPKQGYLSANEARFFQIKQLSHDDEYPRREAFENVLSTLNNEEFNFVYVLTGKEDGIELHIGIVQNREIKEKNNTLVTAGDYAKIVANAFEGNFSGSELVQVSSDKLHQFINASSYKYAGMITGVPSISEDEAGKDCGFQGIDRLVNSMLGLSWRIMIVCEPVSKQEIYEIRSDVFELYNRLSLYAKSTVQQGKNDGATITFGKNVSQTKGKNWGFNKSDTKSKGHSWKDGEHNSSKSHQEGTSEGTSSSNTEGSNQSESVNRGESTSVTIEIANKWAQDLMKYIDEELLERLKLGFGKGLFKTSIYYMAEKPAHAERLKANILSLFQGKGNSYSPLVANTINMDKSKNILNTCQNQYIDGSNMDANTLLLLGRPFYEQKYVGMNTLLTSREISLLAGMPQKEVPGLVLNQGVEFGLNEIYPEKDKMIELGKMVQRGRVLKNVPFMLKKDCMMKHTFIAGVTGSGKTTTCHRLLKEANMPFLVIEPAKTEYRTLINSTDDIVVFTLGNESVAPFRINPFELLPGEIISAHVDMVKASFTSAFPMEASMPQILEEAIYKCYESKGWNIDTNENELYGEKAFDKDVNSFPILSELLEQMHQVVESKGFGQELKSNYIGSLVSRLSNLTVGSKGRMLNCYHSMDFNYIVNNNVVLEMEELKSPEDKALVMGFILSRLSAVIKTQHNKNPSFKHLTLIEEAHRLLSKVEFGDSGSKRTAVETFTDLLAEVRKYGEGLIIVDQIPNKLASEVLKNTNTKIVHKILARDDKEAVGDTMLMDDKQKEYLSALHVGNAIVFSENMDKPVHVSIDRITNTNEAQIDDVVVAKRFREKNLLNWYEEADILAIKKLFHHVALDVTNSEVNKEEYDKLSNLIDKAARKYEKTQEAIWEFIIVARDIEIGKKDGSSVPQNERCEKVKEFFMKTIREEDFSNQIVARDIRKSLMI